MKVLDPKNLFITVISIGVLILFIGKSIDKSDVVAPATSTEISAPIEETEYSPVNEIPAKKTASPATLSAAGAYVMGTMEPLYSFRDEKQWPIASVTKLMTALTARRVMTGEEVVTITEDAISAPGEVGNFKVGERFLAKDLIQAMLVGSSNDAAKAIADQYGKGAFTAEMNKTAVAIGMTDTVFVDAAGLSAANISTPHDLSKLARFIWNEDPQIFTITQRTYINIVDIDNHRSRKLASTNIFAGRANFLGGKTGQIPDSNGNLISIFSLPDKSSPVIIVVLGATDRFKETEKILTKL